MPALSRTLPSVRFSAGALGPHSRRETTQLLLNLPTRVRYVSRAEGGVSHFRMVRDNLLIAWMHTRMVLALIPRLLRARRPRRIAA